jgi:hypothetical protein
LRCEGAAQVRIDTMEVIASSGWIDLAEALAWAAENRPLLELDDAARALDLSRRTVACYLSGEHPVPKTVMLATEGYDELQAA